MGCYIITHKNFKKFTNMGNYKIIFVGAYKSHNFGDLFDDVGNNISKKNNSYCELTGIYWLWKHCQDDYIGVVHYRRYFGHYFLETPLNDKEIRKRLRKYDVILPLRFISKLSVAKQYCDTCGYQEDLDKLRNVIAELYPDYLKSFDYVFGGRFFFPFNMIIARKDLYDEYCSWLFSILNELETVVDMKNYSSYEKRIFGFLAERLETVWIHKKNLKICEMGVISTERKVSSLKKFFKIAKRKVFIIKNGKN